MCITPNITDCTSVPDGTKLIYKSMPDKNCNHERMLFVHHSDGTLIHKCSGKKVCPGKDGKLVVSSDCEAETSKFTRTKVLTSWLIVYFTLVLNSFIHTYPVSRIFFSWYKMEEMHHIQGGQQKLTFVQATQKEACAMLANFNLPMYYASNLFSNHLYFKNFWKTFWTCGFLTFVDDLVAVYALVQKCTNWHKTI